MKIIDTLKSIARNRIGVSILVGILVGIVVMMATKKDDDEDNKMAKTFWTYFLLASALSFSILYVMSRRSLSRPKLETVLENVHKGEPKF